MYYYAYANNIIVLNFKLLLYSLNLNIISIQVNDFNHMFFKYWLV